MLEDSYRDIVLVYHIIKPQGPKDAGNWNIKELRDRLHK